MAVASTRLDRTARLDPDGCVWNLYVAALAAARLVKILRCLSVCSKVLKPTKYFNSVHSEVKGHSPITDFVRPTRIIGVLTLLNQMLMLTAAAPELMMLTTMLTFAAPPPCQPELLAVPRDRRRHRRAPPSGRFSLKPPPPPSRSHRPGPVSQTRFNFWALFALAACHQSGWLVADRNRKEVKEKEGSESEEDDGPSC